MRRALRITAAGLFAALSIAALLGLRAEWLAPPANRAEPGTTPPLPPAAGEVAAAPQPPPAPPGAGVVIPLAPAGPSVSRETTPSVVPGISPPGPPPVGIAPALPPVPPAFALPTAEPARPAPAGPTTPAVRPPVAPGRVAVNFTAPAGVKVSWQVDGRFHDRDLAAPAGFNFTPGRTYRLRLTGHPRFPDRAFYPTLELPDAGDRAAAFLAHCSVPVGFTDAEVVAAAEGRLVVKAVYLPTRSESEPAVESAEVSNLKGGFPGDVVRDAQARGAVLAVLRVGNIDLENPNSPPPGAPATVPDLPPGEVAPPPRAVGLRN